MILKLYELDEEHATNPPWKSSAESLFTSFLIGKDWIYGAKRFHLQRLERSLDAQSLHVFTLLKSKLIQRGDEQIYRVRLYANPHPHYEHEFAFYAQAINHQEKQKEIILANTHPLFPFVDLKKKEAIYQKLRKLKEEKNVFEIWYKEQHSFLFHALVYLKIPFCDRELWIGNKYTEKFSVSIQTLAQLGFKINYDERIEAKENEVVVGMLNCVTGLRLLSSQNKIDFGLQKICEVYSNYLKEKI